MLIDRVYEAAVIPEGWPIVLDNVSRLVNGWGAALHAVDRERGIKVVATREYAPVVGRWAAQADRPENVRPGRFLARRHHGFLSDLDLCTPEELAADRIYIDYFRPVGIGWTCGTVLPLPTTEILVVDLVRQADVGPFDRAAIERLDAIRPHLARAAYLSARLGLAQAGAATEVLGAVGLPAAVLMKSGKVLAANSLLDRYASVIEIGAGDRIRIAIASAQALLVESLQQLASDETAIRSIPLRATPEHPALVLHLIPVRRSANDLFPGAGTLLVVMPVTAPTAPLTEVLNGLFDLTAAEARVARSLTAGGSVNTISDEFGLARETIRGSLKAIFAKTGTHSQSDLVGLLSGVSLPGRQPSPTGGDAPDSSSA